jgi:superfamily II DNA or RNA helicase
MSLAVYLQQAGRALRVDPGKSRAVILDHVGNYYLHGHVLAERQWSLESGRRDPRKEEPPTTTTCPQCYGVWPGRPRTCPACGFSFTEAQQEERRVEFETIRGQLIEAGAPETEADRMAAFVRRTQEMEPAKRQKAMWGKAFEYAEEGEVGKRKLDQLREMAGYRQGWTDRVWEYVQRKRRSA